MHHPLPDGRGVVLLDVGAQGSDDSHNQRGHGSE